MSEILRNELVKEGTLNWFFLSRNSSAIHLLEANHDRMSWNFVSENPNAFISWKPI